MGGDASNGVTYDQGSQSMVFHGTSCDQIKGGGSVKLDIIYGCKGAPIL